MDHALPTLRWRCDWADLDEACHAAYRRYRTGWRVAGTSGLLSLASQVTGRDAGPGRSPCGLPPPSA